MLQYGYFQADTKASEKLCALLTDKNLLKKPYQALSTVPDISFGIISQCNNILCTQVSRCFLYRNELQVRSYKQIHDFSVSIIIIMIFIGCSLLPSTSLRIVANRLSQKMARIVLDCFSQVYKRLVYYKKNYC